MDRLVDSDATNHPISRIVSGGSKIPIYSRKHSEFQA